MSSLRLLNLRKKKRPTFHNVSRQIEIWTGRRDCLVVGQSFFRHEKSSYIDFGGGLIGCRGFFSSSIGYDKGSSEEEYFKRNAYNNNSVFRILWIRWRSFVYAPIFNTSLYYALTIPVLTSSTEKYLLYNLGLRSLRKQAVTGSV